MRRSRAGHPGLTSSYTADGATKTNFAWALHAGVAYKVTNNFTVELALSLSRHGYRRSRATVASFDGTPGRSVDVRVPRPDLRRTLSSACVSTCRAATCRRRRRLPADPQGLICRDPSRLTIANGAGLSRAVFFAFCATSFLQLRMLAKRGRQTTIG